MPRQKLIFILLFLASLFANFSSPSPSDASPSEVGVLGTLYEGNLHNGQEFGFIQEIASWKEYLYVSWQSTDDGEFHIHVWDLKNPLSPIFVEERRIGSSYEDQGYLSQPTNLFVRNGTLFFKTSDILVSYSLGSDGSLSDSRTEFDFRDDRNTTLGSIFFAGSYAGIPRTMLTNNEFLSLPYDQGIERLEEYVILNLENQRTPFLVKTSRDVGLDLVSVDDAINGSYKGLPSAMALSDDLSALNVHTFTKNKTSGLGTFWEDKLHHFFKSSNFNKSLAEINNDVVDSLQLRAAFTNIVDQFRRDRGIQAGATVSSVITSGYNGDVLLSAVLSEYGIHPDDKVSLAFEKIVSPLVRDVVAKRAAAQIHSSILLDWSNRVFQFLSRTELRRVMRDLGGDLNQEISDAGGIAPYLVDKILAPMVGNPRALKLRLSTVIDRIVDNPLATVVNSALTLFHRALPTSELGLGFLDAPRCFRIPRNARALLERALIETGPRLRENGKALFELLRLARYYSNLNGHSRLEREIEALVRDFHSSIINDFIRTFSTIATDIRGGSLADRMNQYAGALNARSVLAESYADALSALIGRRRHGAIDADLSVRDVLEARGLYIEDERRPVGVNAPTVDSLLELLGTLRLSNKPYHEITQLVIPEGETRLRSSALAVLEQLERDVFGPISRNSRLNTAALSFISQRLDPSIMGNLVEDLVGVIITNMNEEVPLPSFVERAVRFSKGDCIAQWEVALEAAAAASSGAGLPQVGLSFIAAEELLIYAYEKATQYLLEFLFSRFLEEILGAAVGDYSSWSAGISGSNSSIDLRQYLGGLSPYRAFVFGTSDKIAVIMDGRMNAQSELREDSTLRLLVVSPSSPNSGRVYEMGSWEEVQTVVHDQGLIAIQGNKEDSLSPAVLFVDFVKSPSRTYTISGDGAEGLYVLNELEHLNGGDLVALRLQSGGVSLVKRP